MTDILTNKTFDELRVGDHASYARELTTADIHAFAKISGDVNPAHVDEAFARQGIFHKIVGHGMWTAALISTVLGTKLPGPGTIYLGQSLKFLRPVAVGDKITAEVRVIKKYVRKPIVILLCKCTNQKGTVVLTGYAKVLAPIEKVKCKRVTIG